jgi:error-prone DNA polymerase
MKYAELLTKSNFSFLTGASHPEELAEAALSQGLMGMALNDRNGLYGVVRAHKKFKAHPDFKYIIGTEVALSDHPPVTLLVQDRKAYAHLCRLISKAGMGQEKAEASLTFSEFRNFLSPDVTGLIALPRYEGGLGTQQFPRWAELKSLFGANLYLPLTRYLDGHDKKRTSQARQIEKEYGISLVATNDVYYHEKNRKQLQDILIAIRQGQDLNKVGYAITGNGERYIKTYTEMQRLYEDLPGALAQTVSIAESCEFSLKELRYTYPSEWIPEGHTGQSYLENLIWKNAPSRYAKGIPEKVHAQILHELKLIKELGYADYFLTIYDIVEFARREQILCQGRGSAANSVICYILGITAIDPVQMNLLFERFISVERNEPPDIDVDFEHERREEVIQYVYRKYGRDRAAMVSAVVTYQRRSALREAAKAFGVHVGTLSAKELEQQIDQLVKDLPHPERVKNQITWAADLMQGFPRHLSIHSGGFTLSALPVIEIVPVENARMEGRTIIQWDKYDLDELGLLKVDLLSLGMLSALRKNLDLVGLKLYEIPHDDPKTYQMIQNRDTVGTFQIESRAQMSMLGRLLPKNFYDLVIEVAIVRPGPIVGQMVHPYLKRRRGLEVPEYPNEIVKNILGRTLGIPLFQEQVMKIAIELAGFTPGEADQLRRCVNAWKTSAPIAEMAKKLMTGLIRSGLSEKFAETFFQQIQGFSHYGFPESHAASFALLAYASCYLKAHHPAEFVCSLINSQPMGFYRTDTLVYDALRRGVKILPVSFEHSEWDCFLESPGVVRLGFRVVRGLGQKAVTDLILERTKKPFTGINDLLKRTHIRRDIISRLALAGGFEKHETNPRQALWALLEYENLIDRGSQTLAQLSLFDFEDESEGASEGESEGASEGVSAREDFDEKQKELSNLRAPEGFEMIQEDYRAFSLSTHGHPMAEIRKAELNKARVKKAELKEAALTKVQSQKRVGSFPKTSSRDLSKQKNKAFVTVAGLILIRQRPPTAKGVVFSTMEDEFGFIDLIIHAGTYDKYKEVFVNQCFVIVQGEVQRDRNTISLLVKSIQPLFECDSPCTLNL